MITFDKFVKDNLNKELDYDGQYDGQCVDLFRYYVQDVLGYPQPKGVTGAANFWTNYETDPNLREFYEKIPNTPTGVPQKGDVMLWNKKAGGGYGHVSVFIEGDVNGFTSFDQNWPTLSVCTKTQHNYTNVYGWLRPKVQSVIIIPQNNMSQFTEEVFNKSKDVLPDQSYNFTDQLDKSKLKDELTVVKFNSLDEERRWRADRTKEIEKLTADYKSLMEVAQKQLSEIERLNNQMQSDIGGIFAPTDPAEVEIPVGDKKPVLTTIGDVVFNFLNSLWNKIKR